jgi:diguanylate cyclase (GGDEF)-like protein
MMRRSKVTSMHQAARILVALDDESLRQTLSRFLTSLGHAVEAVPDGTAAVGRFRSGTPVDLVITNLSMSGLDGLAVMRAARDADRDVEVIFMTGVPDLGTAVQALRAGEAFDYVMKPVPNVEIMRAAVNRAIERRTLRLENQRLRRELERTASTDDLTGVLNRRALFDQGERELSRAARHREPLSLVMFDLDGFQEINDQHGTAAGDAVLARFVQVCRELLRTEDILGRYWADKFVCLLPLTDVASAETVADRIRAKIAITPVEAGDHRITTSASGGLVTRQDADRSLDTLLRRAERALQHAKGHGGDRITVER